MRASFEFSDRDLERKQSSSSGYSEHIDPSLVQTATFIYQGYCLNKAENAPMPLGIVIDRFTHRGQLVFTDNPILLPQECFVSAQLLEEM